MADPFPEKILLKVLQRNTEDSIFSVHILYFRVRYLVSNLPKVIVPW